MTENEPQKMVIVRVGTELLAYALGLPKDVSIDLLMPDVQRPYEVQMRLKGPGLPDRFKVAQNALVEWNVPMLHRVRDEDGNLTVKWEWSE